MDDGLFELDSVEWVRDEEEPSFPTFLVKGKVSGKAFEAKVGLSLDDQDADVEPVSGYDLNAAWEEIPGYDTAGLFIKVSETPAYAEAKAAYEESGE